MYQGWLVYDRAGAEYNKQYIQMHKEEGKKMGIAIQLILSEDITIGVKEGRTVVHYLGQQTEKPDFVICRTIYPFLSAMLEQAGYRVFNSAKVAEIANDKAKTYAYLADKEIPMVDSWFVKNAQLKDVLQTLEDGWVIKAADGHGGQQVFQMKAGRENEIMEKISHSDVVIQPFVKGAGKDVRVYVLGEEILACVCRTATNGFKSNFSLGGSVELYELSEKERQLAEKIISQFSFGLVGIDFLIDENGEFLFNEIEDVVGARMLYQLTDINLVGKYLEFIIERIG